MNLLMLTRMGINNGGKESSHGSPLPMEQGTGSPRFHQLIPGGRALLVGAGGIQKRLHQNFLLTNSYSIEAIPRMT